MGDNPPTGAANLRKLDPLEEQLLEMIQQRAGRPKICREELPTTRAARLKLKQELLDQFPYPPQRQLPFDVENIGERLSAYHAEQLEKPGREILKQLIYPNPTTPYPDSTRPYPDLTRAERQAIPKKFLLPAWATSDWTYSDVKKDMFMITCDLVRLIDSAFPHIDATRRAFSAPGGLSILNGQKHTGKTTVAVLQAIQAALCGHKVLITAPAETDVNAISKQLMKMLRRMDEVAIRDNHDTPDLKVYLATAIWEDGPSAEDLFGELERVQEELHEDRESPVAQLIHRVGPHSLFYQLAIDLDDERRRRSGAQNVRQGRASSQNLDVPLIYNAYKKYREYKTFEALLLLQNGLYSTLERVLRRADIVVTSCLAAGNIPYFDPTVVIVDQWDSDKDWECMIPLTAFDATHFRSIIGNFDIPHWRRMWGWAFPLPLPVQFSVALDAHQPFTSMHSLWRPGIDDYGTDLVQLRKRPRNVSSTSGLKAEQGAAGNGASGADLRYYILDDVLQIARPVEPPGKKKLDSPEMVVSEAIETEVGQIEETDKTMEAGIDYCIAYLGYWYNE